MGFPCKCSKQQYTRSKTIYRLWKHVLCWLYSSIFFFPSLIQSDAKILILTHWTPTPYPLRCAFVLIAFHSFPLIVVALTSFHQQLFELYRNRINGKIQRKKWHSQSVNKRISWLCWIIFEKTCITLAFRMDFTSPSPTKWWLCGCTQHVFWAPMATELFWPEKKRSLREIHTTESYPFSLAPVQFDYNPSLLHIWCLFPSFLPFYNEARVLLC